MKKHYLFFIVLLFLNQASTAQTKSLKTITFGNEQFLGDKNNTGIAYQNNLLNHNNSLWAADRNAHDLLIEREKKAYEKRIEMLVPSTGSEYDVKYYRLELRINPDTSAGNYVKGKVTIYFTTKQANFSIANFDLATALTTDSVYYHGVKLAAGNINRATADLLKITLPTIITMGTLDSVSIYYKGVPPAVPGMAGTGYVTSTHGSPVKKYVYTLSEPYSSYTWWPCKSFIVNDKADSMDMIISTPTGFKVAGNGSLVSETTVGSNIITYWKERYPIAAYQVCTAVANYVQYPVVADTVDISGTKMPVYNYLFPETNTAAAHTSLDRVKLMITTFNTAYGDYPFKNEKYGNYTFGFGGGMEHNTFSGESSSGVYTAAANWDILAHELAHQWWGANVTCGSWHDIWVNESFADFSEGLCIEFAPSIGAAAGNTALSWRQMKKANSINAIYQAKTTYVTDTTDILTIFTPSVYIYDRGGMIITMLRATLGDTKFFQALKNYQIDPLLMQGNGLTADVKRNMESASGLNLTTFFNNWMYNTGYAKYSGITGSVCEWNNTSNNLVLKLVQKTQSSGITHFDMPVVVRIQGSAPATMDTTVIVYDQGGILFYDNNGVLTSTGSNLINFKLSFTPVTITFDPFSQLLASGTFTKNTLLPVTVLATKILNFSGKKEGNTAKLFWSIDNSLEYVSFQVERSTDGLSFETAGTIKAVDNPGKYNFSFIDKNMLPGTGYYRIKILQNDGSVLYTKTIAIANTSFNNDYIVTPNPASEFIIIKGIADREVVDIKIYDANGKLIKKLMQQIISGNNNLQISVQELITGNYFVEIHKADKSSYTKQIVILK